MQALLVVLMCLMVSLMHELLLLWKGVVSTGRELQNQLLFAVKSQCCAAMLVVVLCGCKDHDCTRGRAHYSWYDLQHDAWT
jgi:hypothetical protein